MKKNILYIAMACFALGFAGCSDDPEDAVSKHVYGPDEAPYLRTDLDATIGITAEFREGHISPKTINLKDYAEQIQTKMKMTVDDMLADLESGKVVFYNINTARGIWNKAATTKGSNGWWYNESGLISDASNGAASIEIDKTQKALIVTVPENTRAGLGLVANVGFAIDNGKDYDDYIRFNIEVKVTNPGLILLNLTIPGGDYNYAEVSFEDCESAIQACMGLSVKDFCSRLDNDEIRMYIVEENGEWNTTADYTASPGFWMSTDNKITGWSGDGYNAGNLYYLEMHTEDKSMRVGRAPAVPSGTPVQAHFVYADASDYSKYVEFLINISFE